MPPNETPAVDIRLQMEGQGIREVNSQLKDQVLSIASMEKAVNRIGGAFDGMARKITAVGLGLGGLAILNDLQKLETAAVNAALAIDQVAGGKQGYRQLAGAMQSAGVATSTSALDLSAAYQALTQRTGGAWSRNSPSRQRELGVLIGTYGQAYNIDPTQLGNTLGGLQLFQGQGESATRRQLQMMANQAAKAGMAGMTPQFIQTVAGLATSLISSSPYASNPNAAHQLGAMYGAAAKGNQVFRDPGVFGAGVTALDQGLSNAYQNPRLQAAMSMAGISYTQQREGLAGKGGPDMVRKLMSFADRQYGKNTIQRDLFLRSNFGEVSTDMLNAFAKGHVTYDQLMKEKGGAAPADLAARSALGQSTPLSALTKKQQQVEQAGRGPAETLFDAISHMSAAELIAAGFAAKVGGKLVFKGAGKLLSKAGQLRAQSEVTKAEELARKGARAAGDYTGWTADEAAKAGGGGFLSKLFGGAGKALGKVGSIGGRILGGPEALIGSLLAFPDSTSAKDGRVTVPGKHPKGDPLDRFDKAIDKFGRAVDQDTATKKAHMTGASYDTNTIGGAISAGMPGMILASYLGGSGGGGGGGGGGLVNASLTTGGSPGGSVGATPSGGYSKDSFARAVLRGVGVPASAEAVRTMLGWMAAEGGHWNNNATYNPLNTTMNMPGARSINSAGVKAYRSWSQGIQATVKTLLLPAYKSVLDSLRNGGKGAASAIGASPWGTSAAGVQGAINAQPSAGSGASSGSASSGAPGGLPAPIDYGAHRVPAIHATSSVVHVHVHLDGRQIDQQRRLVRGVI